MILDVETEQPKIEKDEVRGGIYSEVDRKLMRKKNSSGTVKRI